MKTLATAALGTLLKIFFRNVSLGSLPSSSSSWQVVCELRFQSEEFAVPAAPFPGAWR